jgi:hypothetical protein
MPKITKNNTGVKMCSELSCSDKPEYFENIKYLGLDVQIVLCERHYQIVGDKYIRLCPSCGATLVTEPIEGKKP